MDFFDCPFAKDNYCCPGVYSVYCVITQNGIYGESDNIYDSLFTIYYQLLEGSHENAALQKEFQVYGVDCFRFIPVYYGDKYNDPAFRQEELDRLNQLNRYF